MTLRRVLSLALAVTSLAQVPQQQGPQPGQSPLPPELEKYRTVLPHDSAPPELSPAELAALQKHGKEQEIGQRMAEYRRTGQTTLSKAEIDDFLDSWGTKKNQPKFDTLPVCKPKKIGDNCATGDEWAVYLDPSVKISDCEQTVADLMATYNMQKHPTRLHDYELLTGAYFVVTGSEINAERLSKDPRVRIVGRDRYIMGSLDMTPDSYKETLKAVEEGRKLMPKRTPTPRPNKGGPKPIIIKPTAQSVPFNLDRSDQRNLPTDNSFQRPNNGQNAEIYMLGDVSITIYRHESLTSEQVLDLLVKHYKAWCVNRPGGRRSNT